MSSGAARRLTDRQQAVIERIDRRVPIKVIAQELGVSETRINQHIRALKDIYEAASLVELVENYRATLPPVPTAEGIGETPREGALEITADAGLLKVFSEAAYSKNQVPEHALKGDVPVRTDPGELVMSDVSPLEQQAPWLRPGEPRVVHRVLDGENAVLFRLAAIMGIAFGFLAAVVLTVTAALTISEALDGQIASSVEQASLS